MAFAATLVFTSCTGDDENNDCESCTAQGQKIEICNNGDGTYTLSGGGESETVTQEELDTLELTAGELVELTCSLANGAL